MNLVEARKLARRLMDEHGLQDWRFVWTHSRNTLGSCWSAQRTIKLSAELTALNSEEQMRDTILHEIAHALVGPGVKHGPAWVAQAIALGAAPQKCAVGATRPPYKWLGTCTCGASWKRDRLSQRLRTANCGRCHAPIRWSKTF